MGVAEDAGTPPAHPIQPHESPSVSCPQRDTETYWQSAEATRHRAPRSIETRPHDDAANFHKPARVVGAGQPQKKKAVHRDEGCQRGGITTAGLEGLASTIAGNLVAARRRRLPGLATATAGGACVRGAAV